MTPQRSSAVNAAISERMSLIHSQDTAPEMLVRSLLSARRVRYRLHYRKLPGRPDVYIGRIRTALQIQGCFWHQHDCKSGRRMPRSNLDYWKPKLLGNLQRDIKNRRLLKQMGVRVVYLWTCEIDSFEAAIDDIAADYYAAQRDRKG